MPGIDDIKKRLAAIAERVRERLPEIATTLSLSAKALAERNIKEKGFGSTYSPNKIPAWFLHGKELNAAGTKFLENHGVHATTGAQGKGKKKRRKKKGDPDPGHFDTTTNWKEFRDAQGLQTAFVDLSYTNKMFANMAPGEPEIAGNIVRAPLSATNIEAQKKMNWNFERYGDFIGKALTPDDFNILGEIPINEVLAILDEFKT